jgi:hypothetical protein
MGIVGWVKSLGSQIIFLIVMLIMAPFMIPYTKEFIAIYSGLKDGKPEYDWEKPSDMWIAALTCLI